MKYKAGNKSSEVRLIVPFHDCDPIQVVWHGNYFKCFDVARFELFHQCGVDLYEYYQKSRYLFPLTKTSTKYISPLRHKDEFTCSAFVIDARIKIVLDFEIRLTSDGRVCAKARSEQVAVKMPDMELMLQIPDDVRKAFGC